MTPDPIPPTAGPGDAFSPPPPPPSPPPQPPEPSTALSSDTSPGSGEKDLPPFVRLVQSAVEVALDAADKVADAIAELTGSRRTPPRAGS